MEANLYKVILLQFNMFRNVKELCLNEVSNHTSPMFVRLQFILYLSLCFQREE